MIYCHTVRDLHEYGVELTKQFTHFIHLGKSAKVTEQSIWHYLKKSNQRVHTTFQALIGHIKRYSEHLDSESQLICYFISAVFRNYTSEDTLYAALFCLVKQAYPTKPLVQVSSAMTLGQGDATEVK